MQEHKKKKKEKPFLFSYVIIFWAISDYLDDDIFDACFWFFICILEISFWTYKTKLLKSKSGEERLKAQEKIDNTLLLILGPLFIGFGIIKYFYFDDQKTLFILIITAIIFIISIYFKYFIKKGNFEQKVKAGIFKYITIKLIYRCILTIICLHLFYITILMIKYI